MSVVRVATLARIALAAIARRRGRGAVCRG